MPIKNPLQNGTLAGCIGNYGHPTAPNKCKTCKTVKICKATAKNDFKKQFHGVTIEYLQDFIRVSVDFKEPNDFNTVWLDISKNTISINKTTRNGGEALAEFHYW
jgi:hypothetical protein